MAAIDPLIGLLGRPIAEPMLMPMPERPCQHVSEAKTERFVLSRTHKAVNLTNVMGETKRATEMVISHLLAMWFGRGKELASKCFTSS